MKARATIIPDDGMVYVNGEARKCSVPIEPDVNAIQLYDDHARVEYHTWGRKAQRLTLSEFNEKYGTCLDKWAERGPEDLNAQAQFAKQRQDEEERFEIEEQQKVDALPADQRADHAPLLEKKAAKRQAVTAERTRLEQSLDKARGAGRDAVASLKATLNDPVD